MLNTTSENALGAGEDTHIASIANHSFGDFDGCTFNGLSSSGHGVEVDLEWLSRFSIEPKLITRDIISME